VKILFANKFFYPKGGAEISLFTTADLLEKKGHTISYFAMQHPQNLPTPFNSYFVSQVDYENNPGFIQQLRTTGRLLYSFEAKNKIAQLIKSESPDIAHLNNIYHQISPSIIDTLKKNRIPIVMTLRDYKLTCPVYTHLSHNQVCDECRKHRFYKVVTHRCTKNSFLKSTINMVEMYLHHSILHIYNKVDCFIAPSKFLRDKTLELGFKGNIVHLPNFIDVSEYIPVYPATENSLVYFGRLSEEKGLFTLLDAIKRLDIQLKIIGDGPQKELLLQKIKQEQISNVSLLGYKNRKELLPEIQQSIGVVIPSEWYENNPRAILESFAVGKPVIGSNIGGIPELVKDSETGFLFTPGNSEALRDKIIQMKSNLQKTREMGRTARHFVETNLNPDKHYQQLIEIYEQAMGKKR
jgi:glycosyltransferase involved in cell wall biosynthesis